MLNFEEFTVEVKDAVESWYEGYIAEVVQATRTNETYTGLSVGKKGNRVSPVINMDQIYKFYQNDHSLREALELVASILDDGQSTAFGTLNQSNLEKLIKDYEHVKNRLCLKVTGMAYNQKELNEIPHKQVEDLALTCHIWIEDISGYIAVSQKLLDVWGVSWEKVFADTLKNAVHMFPVTTMFMEEFFANAYSNIDLTLIPKEMLIISTEQTTFGAAALFYPGMMDSIAEKMGGSYILLPSSIHEFLAVKDNDENQLKELEEMVIEINRTELEENEILSDSVYYYDAAERKFQKWRKHQPKAGSQHNKEIALVHNVILREVNVDGCGGNAEVAVNFPEGLSKEELSGLETIVQTEKMGNDDDPGTEEIAAAALEKFGKKYQKKFQDANIRVIEF